MAKDDTPKYPCRRLSPEEIEALEKKYEPPLTAKERAEKQSRDAVSPDWSHMKSPQEFNKR